MPKAQAESTEGVIIAEELVAKSLVTHKHASALKQCYSKWKLQSAHNYTFSQNSATDQRLSTRNFAQPEKNIQEKTVKTQLPIDWKLSFGTENQARTGKKYKKEFSHTRYRALGPELIPVYRQSARWWREVNHAIHPAVACRYFLPGLQLPP